MKEIEAYNNDIRIRKCKADNEWRAAQYFRNKYFFDPLGIDDPYTWTFKHEDHVHLVLYEGCEIVGYMHIQFWPDSRAALRIMAVDEAKRNRSLGSKFLTLGEKWLKGLEIKSIHAESRQTSLRFYLKNGFLKMPFNDPEGHETDPQDISLGKIL